MIKPGLRSDMIGEVQVMDKRHVTGKGQVIRKGQVI